MGRGGGGPGYINESSFVFRLRGCAGMSGAGASIISGQRLGIFVGLPGCVTPAGTAICFLFGETSHLQATCQGGSFLFRDGPDRPDFEPFRNGLLKVTQAEMVSGPRRVEDGFQPSTQTNEMQSREQLTRDE